MRKIFNFQFAIFNKFSIIKFLILFLFLLITYHLSLITAYAADLSNEFGFGHIQSAGDFFSKLVMPVFEIAGVALLFYTVIAAIKYMTSEGDKEAVAGARAMITHSIIGFLLLIVLFLILEYLPPALGIPGLAIIGR